jgi:hypothetical protein
MQPSFSAGNGPIAFASAATNLVFGVFPEVGAGYESFVITELKPPAVPGVSYISPLPPNPTISPTWQLSATVERGPHGSVLLSVSVPGAGRLAATATASVPLSRLGASKARRARTGSPRRGRRLVKVTLARAVTGAGGPGIVELHLAAARQFASAISGAHGLSAMVRLTFAAVGEAPLAAILPVDFLGVRHLALTGRRARSSRRGPRGR